MATFFDEIVVAPVTAGARRVVALELVFSRRAFSERVRLMRDLLQPESIANGSLAGLWEARRGEQMLGAVFALLLPGRTALVYQPRLHPSAAPEVASRLWTALDTYLRQHHVQVAQELLPHDAADDAQATRAAGFQIETELVYLSRAAGEASIVADVPRQVEFVPYQPTACARMEALLPLTYEGTLDCPELNGVRSSHDVLEGYLRNGTFQPHLWSFVRREGEDVGCILLASHGGQILELMYMGLIPTVRSQGLGKLCMAHAQRMLILEGCEELTVAVDHRNAPARRLYEQAGMAEFDRRRVLLRVL